MFWERLIALEGRGFKPRKTTVEAASQREALKMEQDIEFDRLAQAVLLLHLGFSMDEARAVCKLREWYQSGGSDRAPVLYHLEFLRRLVASGVLTR